MSVQDRAGTHTARDGDVEQRFRRGPSISADDVDGIIPREITALKFPLVPRTQPRA